MIRRDYRSACQIALHYDLPVDKVNGSYVVDCRVCEHSKSMRLTSEGRFVCTACGVHGNAALLDSILRRMGKSGR